LNKDKYKSEFFGTLTENLFDDLLLDLISNSSYKYDLSPKGILSVLNFMHDLIVNDYKVLFKKVLRDHFLKQLTNFFKVKQYQAIQDWPGYKKEEGVLIAQGILTTVLKIIKISSEVNGITEEVIKGDFFLNLKNSFEIANKDCHKLIISIIHNLVNGKGNNDDIVNNITTDHFSQYPNLKFIENYNLMKDYFNKDLVVEILLFLSCLCRKSQNVYSALHQLNILPDLKFLLEGNDSGIKSRVCNLLGNMCRHTDFFYDELRISGIVPALLKCCFDPDKSTRKFACFAIGNAAFMNDKLYENFRSIIPKMVELLRDPEDNTRANSAGALGNFVRCGDSLSNDILANKAHEALLQLAENEDLPAQISIIKVALFALGNFCYHQVIKIELDKINFRGRIENLRTKFKNEPQLLEHIERIRKKLRE
jgi:fused-like protein